MEALLAKDKCNYILRVFCQRQQLNPISAKSGKRVGVIRLPFFPEQTLKKTLCFISGPFAN
jgi:hypothetical protein